MPVDSLPQSLRKTLRVLVIEDEERYRRFLLELLKDMGCDPLGAATAQEAFKTMSHTTPEALILDLNLPVMDGMEFLARFRRDHDTTPVIILTGVGDLRSAQEAIRHGVTEFLTKPCHLGQIEAALDRVRRQIAKQAESERKRAEVTASAAGEGKPIGVIEREAIFDALLRHRGNRSAAAAELGISRRTLYSRIEKYRSEGHLPPAG